MENQPQRKFRSISIYFDGKENLVGIPCGKSEKYGVADIDVTLLLKAPYTDQELGDFIQQVLDQCYTKKHNDKSGYSTIEKYTHVKGYRNATRKLGLITLVFFAKEGYSIMPTYNDPERGYVLIEEEEVKLPLECPPGEVAGAVRSCVVNFNRFKEPEKKSAGEAAQ